jgi:[ribosomal protein S18]-alanine N-acetyltransferase
MSVEQPDSGPIREGTEADLGRILEIERLSFEKHWYPDDFKSALNELFLVYREKEVLGFLSACCSASAPRAVIMRIAVHPDHRGKGIATKLLRAILDRLRKMRIEEVALDVEIVKRGAIELYEKFGFRTREVITVNGDEESESFLEMTLKLDAE